MEGQWQIATDLQRRTKEYSEFFFFSQFGKVFLTIKLVYYVVI